MSDLEKKLDAALSLLRAPKPVAKKTPGGHRWWYRPIANPVTHKQDAKDWDLVTKWLAVESTAIPSLLSKAQVQELLRETWKYTDAYGEVGVWPAQGWDWSGIRDSSAGAKRKMAAVIRKLLKKWGIKP